MVRTCALAWMVGVALLALGALGGCSGSVGGDHPGLARFQDLICGQAASQYGSRLS